MSGSATEQAPSLPHDLLDRPVGDWHRVSPSLAGKLQKLQLFTLRDVLFHLPLRYIDKTRVTAIMNLQLGHPALVEGTIVDSGMRRYGNRKMLYAVLADVTGQLQLRFFHAYRGQQQRFRPGVKMRCYGQARQGYSGGLEMVHPECSSATGTALDSKFTPVYPSTEGLTQRTLRQLTGKAISLLSGKGQMKPLPSYVECDVDGALPGVEEALRFMHQPPPGTDLEQLQAGKLPPVRRLAFEELLAFRLALLQSRAKVQAYAAAAMTIEPEKFRSFVGNLPFVLTEAQQRAMDDINADMAKAAPMQRLLQGDVGSGKTVVAAAAALNAISNGYSACVMAPTELLAQQHYQTMSELLALSGDERRVLLFTNKITGAQRRECKQQLMDDKPCVVIGTHALVQEDFIVNKLALAVIDEQHRFGVNQRLELLQRGDDKSLRPHQLTMTATPIPRTLAMTMYANLDVSTLNMLPEGRKDTITTVMNSERRDEVIDRALVQCQQKRQAYWVCSLIDESEQLQKQAAVTTYEYLRGKLPQLNVGLIHGRLKAAEKDNIMRSFMAGEMDLLVATTVIEVGIDVPNANLMIIENAERLGLAQLHQLRGRIGRGQEQGYCLLLYDPPLGTAARSRLDTIKQSNDGFAIAEQDLMLRGTGELFGLRQTGMPEMRIADFARDADLMPAVVAAAEQLLRQDPEFSEEVIARWQAARVRYSET